MRKNYDINEIIKLRDVDNLLWKEIEKIIGISSETLRKAYKRNKEGITSVQQNPSKQEVLEQYDLLGTWDKVAEHFGLTRKIIQGIRKRE